MRTTFINKCVFTWICQTSLLKRVYNYPTFRNNIPLHYHTQESCTIVMPTLLSLAVILEQIFCCSELKVEHILGIPNSFTQNQFSSSPDDLYSFFKYKRKKTLCTLYYIFIYQSCMFRMDPVPRKKIWTLFISPMSPSKFLAWNGIRKKWCCVLCLVIAGTLLVNANVASPRTQNVDLQGTDKYWRTLEGPSYSWTWKSLLILQHLSSCEIGPSCYLDKKKFWLCFVWSKDSLATGLLSNCPSYLYITWREVLGGETQLLSIYRSCIPWYGWCCDNCYININCNTPSDCKFKWIFCLIAAKLPGKSFGCDITQILVTL